MPVLSVVLPVERGHQFLVAALDGFLRQSIPPRQIEILIVTPRGVTVPLQARHKKLAVRKVGWPQRRSLASAMNAAARAAGSPVLVLLGARWLPLAGLAAYSLAFHQSYPALADTVTLSTALDAGLADDPLWWWLDQQHLAGLSAPTAGIHNWRALRFDALSVKRDLLRRHPLPIANHDEWLIKEQWGRRVPLRVFVEPAPLLAASGRLSLTEVMSADYRASHARLNAMRSSSQTFAGEHVDDRFQHPEKYLLSQADRRELMSTIDEMTLELTGRHPRFAEGEEAERFALLGRLYLVAVSHARALGWSDAKAGRAPNPARV